MQANEAEWYNKFYNGVELEMGPWQRFLLPDLRRGLNPQARLLELGCGQGQVLRYLVREKLLPEENIFALDQSQTAVDFLRQCLPKAQVTTGDLYSLKFPPDYFDFCLLLETIEHLEEPLPPLKSIFSHLAPGGLLYVSFPNFLHLPWLAVRILAEKLNRPNWIVLQPVDKIYTVFGVIRLVERAGFKFERAIGSNYGPPLLYRLETDSLTRFLNALGLWWLSFHPILVFRRPTSPMDRTGGPQGAAGGKT